MSVTYESGAPAPSRGFLVPGRNAAAAASCKTPQPRGPTQEPRPMTDQSKFTFARRVRASRPRDCHTCSRPSNYVLHFQVVQVN